LGHVVGDELYLERGIEGIEICTQEFRNACSHSIVIGALTEFGTSDATVEKIRNACARAPGGAGAYTMCFHGLGHGVFAYFGYDLAATVGFCKRLGTIARGNQEYPQCVGGAIMELVGGGGHDHEKWAAAHERYLGYDDPLAPCDEAVIPDETKSFCYIYLTPHLFEAAGSDLNDPDPERFGAAMAFCDPIRDERLRTTCYGGFGKEFLPLAGARDIRRVDAFSDDQYRNAIAWCRQGPSAEAQTACVREALGSVFWGGENDTAASFRFCGLVDDGALQDACYRNLARNIAVFIPPPERPALCAKLPADAAPSCRS
jgi:hypothetical protein